MPGKFRRSPDDTMMTLYTRVNISAADNAWIERHAEQEKQSVTAFVSTLVTEAIAARKRTRHVSI